MYNGKRTIGFDNCERYYAKGTHGIKGIREIPDLENPNNNNNNDFLTKLFEEMDNNIANEAMFYEEDRKHYEEVMNEIKPKIDEMTEDNVMEVMALIKNSKHYLTSQKELQHIFKSKCEELGLVWNSETKKYEKKLEEVKDGE